MNFAEREAVFKGVCGSDKWTRQKNGEKGDAKDGEVEEEDEDEDEADPAPGIVDTSSALVFFHMELHPRVPK